MERGRVPLLPRIFALCLFLPLLVSCAGEGFALSRVQDVSNPSFERIPPPVQLAQFSGAPTAQASNGGREAMIDTGNAAKGYVTASCKADTNVKFRLSMGTYQYDYDMTNDGTYNYFPLAVGNGSYSFKVYINLADSGSQYEEFLQDTVNVTLESEQAPFLVPNIIVDYTADSGVIQQSYDILEHASSDLEVAQQIYSWIEHNIAYDTERANSIIGGATGYLPDLDEIIRTKKGICYDYAALAGAMFRANGIPCKLVMGDVKTKDGIVYHAWNYLWLDEVGEVAVKLPSTPEEWQRLDLTFAASGAASGNLSISEFIGDGSNYTDTYFH